MVCRVCGVWGGWCVSVYGSPGLPYGVVQGWMQLDWSGWDESVKGSPGQSWAGGCSLGSVTGICGEWGTGELGSVALS